MYKIIENPYEEKTSQALREEYEFLENYKHSTGHPLIKKVCTHRQNIILDYLNSNTLSRTRGE